jgi:hypothetical protein
MARKKAAESILAPVDEYPEKYDDLRTDEETLLAEARGEYFPQVEEWPEVVEVEDRPMDEVEAAMQELRAQQLGVSVDDLPAQPQPAAEEG